MRPIGTINRYVRSKRRYFPGDVRKVGRAGYPHVAFLIDLFRGFWEVGFGVRLKST